MSMTIDEVKLARSGDIAVTSRSVKSNDAAREQISADIEDFLDNNGKIEQLPYLVSGEPKAECNYGRDSIGRKKGEWHKQSIQLGNAAAAKKGA